MSEDGRILISEWPPPEEEEEEGDEKEEEEHGEPEALGEVELRRRVQEKGGDRKRMSVCEEWETVDRLLARWYRQSSEELKMKYPGLLPQPGKGSPRTILDIAASTLEGRVVLKARVRELEQMDREKKNSFGFHYHMACLLDRLGEREAALSSNWTALAIAGVDSRQLKTLQVKKYLAVVRSLSEEHCASLWLQFRLQHQFSFSETRPVDSTVKLEVEGRDYSQLTRESFQEQFCRPRRPLVLHNVPSPTEQPWSLEYVRKMAGHCSVQVRSPLPGSSEWAGLEGGGHVKVEELLASGFPASGQYLFDWSLPLHCPALASKFTLPHLFSENYLTMTSDSALYHNSWPSLFIASKGTHSGLHIDAFGSHFWMYLVSGIKRWTFYPADQVANLNPVFLDSMDPVFRPSEDDLSRVPCYSLDLAPGQLLFVPSGCPHRVDNLEDSIAVSGNFVDESNIEDAVKHLRISALQDPRAGDLLAELADLGLVS